MIQIFDKQTGQSVGSLTDEQFQFLVDNLEEESREDDDYYLNRATIDILAEQGAPPELVAVLQAALGSQEETEIRWQRS